MNMGMNATRWGRGLQNRRSRLIGSGFDSQAFPQSQKLVASDFSSY